MGRFVADPIILRQNAGKIMGNSEQFQNEINKIYSLKEKLLKSGYVGPEAKRFGDIMDKDREKLNAMARIIARYGKFLGGTATKVTRNQDNIILGNFQ